MVALCCPLVLVISALQSSYLANGILCYVTCIFIVSRRCVKTLFLWPDSYMNFYWSRPYDHMLDSVCQRILTNVKFVYGFLKLFMFYIIHCCMVAHFAVQEMFEILRVFG